MLKISMAAVLGLLLSASLGVHAESIHGKRYAGVAVGFLELEDDDAGGLDFTHFEGRIGGYANENLSFEGRLGTGVTGDEIDDTDIDMRYMLGLYARLGMPAGDVAYPYLFAGFTRADFDFEVDTDAETDLSYGLGVDLGLQGFTVFIEYAQLVEFDAADLSGFSIGLKSSF